MISGFIEEQIFDERNQTRNEKSFSSSLHSAPLLIKCEEINKKNVHRLALSNEKMRASELFFVLLIIRKNVRAAHSVISKVNKSPQQRLKLFIPKTKFLPQRSSPLS